MADGAPGRHARGTNQVGMRDHNERLVLTLLRANGALAKAPVARMTGLSAQTASVIMRKLEEDGLIHKGEPQRGRIGQPSIPLHLTPEGAYFLGLKVGRRSYEAGLIDFCGNTIGRTRRLHAYPDLDACLDFAAEAVAELTALLPADKRDRVAGLGIALPFLLWDWADALGIDRQAMIPWRDRDIEAELTDRLGLPVHVQNDATAACGAELVFGRARMPRDVVHIYVGYFVGGGLVLDGSLFTGRAGNAGAVGSLLIPGPDGPRQLIDVASLAVLERRLADAGGQPDQLWRDIDGWDLPADVLDPWLDEAAEGLAHAIATAAAVIDAEAALIDGWLPPDIRSRLAAKVDAALGRLDLSGIERPSILEGTLGPEARMLGAAALPLSHRFLVDRSTLGGIG